MRSQVLLALQRRVKQRLEGRSRTWSSTARRPGASARSRDLLHTTMHALGIHVSRYPGLGLHIDADITYLLTHVPQPTVLDVGANAGQTVLQLKSLLPDCRLHAFEPSPQTFLELEGATRGIHDLTLTRAGVGQGDGVGTLLENEHSVMTSFLAPSTAAGGTVIEERPVPMVSLDSYCDREQIETIDFLKIDTQGYDLQVLKGAQKLLAEKRVRIVQLELIFVDMYVDAASFDGIYRFLVDHGFRLFALYDLHFAAGAASWADAIFVNGKFSGDAASVASRECGRGG